LLRHTNRLIDEHSPYLLQHAHNPVDWRPWGEEAFETARREDKPIFLSIGYSTCHWCHVMERESFESDEIAAVLNRHYVPIKVDREERPDVDRIYMLFVQATTGGGGWPMSVWLTPELKPFFGGTYFPPDNRYGRPGFGAILEHIAQLWRNDRPKISESSNEIVAQLERHAAVGAGASSWMDDSILDSCYQIFRRTYDSRLGGFGGAPKFPRPVTHNFLLRHWSRTHNPEALEMVLGTLRAMALGGMNDQMGGGFHRYSVDERWFVPHFEKMLYDQAQLAISYLEAYQISGDAGLAGVARDIFEYVLRDMTHPDGGFYSAEDADSVIDAADPSHKGEGAFYIWTQAELEQLLGAPAASWFCYRYGVEPNGNVHQDPHEEFTGKNILYEAHSLDDTAAHFGVGAAEVAAALEEARGKLMAARSGRVRPHLDDKVLTAWNGLMISAFALGAQALDEPRYLEAARRAADFVLERMFDASTGRLLRRFRAGEAGIDGFLDDYAFFLQALLDLYEASFEFRYLETAAAVAATMLARFEDAATGGFFSTAAGDASLLLRMKDDYDGAEPTGNSIAVLALLRLAEMTGSPRFRAAADRTLEAFAPRMRATPVGLPQMLAAYMFAKSKPRQIVLAGEAGSAQAMLAVVRRRFLPHKIVLLADEASRARLAEWLPALAGMTPVDGKATAYICENYACQLPVTDPERFAELLQ